MTLLRLWAPATVATLCLSFLALLHVLPDASRAAVVASVVVLALAAIASSYVRSSLVELAAQAKRDAMVQRKADVQRRRVQADLAPAASLPDAEVVREIAAAVKGVIINLTLIAEHAKPGVSADEVHEELVLVEQAVAKAVAECNQMTFGFAAELPAEHRHAFNNAVMPLSYSLDKATKRLTRLLHRTPAGRGDRAQAWLDGARAGAERIAVLVRRPGPGATVAARGA